MGLHSAQPSGATKTSGYLCIIVTFNNSAHRVQDISWNESQHFVVDNFQLLIADPWWQLCFWKRMSEGLLA